MTLLDRGGNRTENIRNLELSDYFRIDDMSDISFLALLFQALCFHYIFRVIYMHDCVFCLGTTIAVNHCVE